MYTYPHSNIENVTLSISRQALWVNYWKVNGTVMNEAGHKICRLKNQSCRIVDNFSSHQNPGISDFDISNMAEDWNET